MLILPVTNGFLNTRMPRWFYSGAVSGESWTDLRTDEKPKASAHVCGSSEASTINNVKTGAPNCRRVVYGGLLGKVITLSRGGKTHFLRRCLLLGPYFRVCDVFVLAPCVI